MKLHNSYQVYKQDTQRLLYWMVRASNAVIKSLAASGNDPALELNATGQVPVSGLIPMSELIAKNLDKVPSAIYKLFRSVIKLRSEHYAQFQQLASLNPDEDLQKSNASHKFFIDTLTKAFEILGGEAWSSAQKTGNTEPDRADEDVDHVIFSNKFSALNLGTDVENEEDAEDSDEESDQDSKPTQAAQKRQKRAPKGKGKKGKGKKAKSKRKPVPKKEQTIDDVPLESYRIIEDDTGIITEYLMATYALAKEWIGLRNFLQSIWREVAYDNLNSSVAGVLANIAVAMIKQSEATIFVDFPGHDSYETVMKTLTRGDPDKIQGNFQIARYIVTPGSASELERTAMDVKEQFLIHTYQHLVDFAEDFQKSRSGKPTKRMLAEIGNWDPKFNLQKATKEERLKWRRSYTINWLYDLVNVFSSIVVQRNTMKGEKHLYERVDWSPSGPWAEHRRLFGLNEFAGEVTTLAMQKPGTDIRRKIQPHLVFQLQCIIDSLTISRGWSISGLRGHVLREPAPGFRPRRDVDMFLDRECKRVGSGYLQGVYVLKQLYQKYEIKSGKFEFHKDTFMLLEMISDDFRDWLGESKYMYGLTNIPPSRFSNTSANGLWEYSPYLCGVGLMEALEIAYRYSMKMWERMREPMLIVHLHNMLVKRGHLSRPIGLYGSLEELFQTSFFGKQVPTSDFVTAFTKRTKESHSYNSKLRAEIRSASRAADIHGLMDVKTNVFFKQKSNLLLYREANWDPDRIPESEIEPWSLLGMLRLSQVKFVYNPATDDWGLEKTDLVKRALASGVPEEDILEMTANLKMSKHLTMPVMPNLEGYRPAPVSDLDGLNKPSRRAKAARNEDDDDDDVSGSTMLGFLKTDILNDVAGVRPISSLNFVWVTARMMMIFQDMEEQLARRRNASYMTVYEDPDFPFDKRIGITIQGLIGEDEECMKIMAEVFVKHRGGFMHHIYWEDLDTELERLKKSVAQGPDAEDLEAGCCVM